MSGFICPKCGEQTDVFKSGGGEIMARQMGVPFLGRIPIDPDVVRSCDSGKPFVFNYSKSQTAKAFESISSPILELDNNVQKSAEVKSITKGEKKMRIAIPVAQERLSQHFGHCDQFAIFDIDDNLKKIVNRNDITPPAHEPGILPKWLHENNVNIVIAGGMGQRAQQLFAQNDIKVVVGATSSSPEEIVSAYLGNSLETGDNICDH
jgi:predicted Fe-Mo cluster-binding NifX family protein